MLIKIECSEHPRDFGVTAHYGEIMLISSCQFKRNHSVSYKGVTFILKRVGYKDDRKLLLFRHGVYVYKVNETLMEFIKRIFITLDEDDMKRKHFGKKMTKTVYLVEHPSAREKRRLHKGLRNAK